MAQSQAAGVIEALEAAGYVIAHPDQVTEEMNDAAEKVLLNHWRAEPPPFQGANFAVAAALRAALIRCCAPCTVSPVSARNCLAA